MSEYNDDYYDYKMPMICIDGGEVICAVFSRTIVTKENTEFINTLSLLIAKLIEDAINSILDNAPIDYIFKFTDHIKYFKNQINSICNLYLSKSYKLRSIKDENIIRDEDLIIKRFPLVFDNIYSLDATSTNLESYKDLLKYVLPDNGLDLVMATIEEYFDNVKTIHIIHFCIFDSDASILYKPYNK